MRNIARQLHCVSYVTWDMAKTARFWTQIMGLQLVGHVSLPSVPGTQKDCPYLHLFFSLKNGSELAFLEVRNVAFGEQEIGICKAFKHISFEVVSQKELYDYCQRLQAANVPYIGPEEDTFNQYIYFFDPNEIKVQIALPRRTLREDDRQAADKLLKNWLLEKSGQVV